MKISIREISLLVLLAIVGWGYVAYTFLITPAIEGRDEAERRLDEVSSQERAIMAKIGALGNLGDLERVEMERIQAASEEFYPDLIEENIIAYVHELAVASGLRVTTITAGGVKLVDIDSLLKSSAIAEKLYAAGELAKEITGFDEPDEEEPAAPASSSRSSIIENGAFAYSFSVDFSTADYGNVCDFFAGFEKFGKLTLIDDVSIKKTTEQIKVAAEITDLLDGDTFPVLDETYDAAYLTGKFTINLLAIDTIIYIETVFPNVELVTPVGKADPFAFD